MNINGNASLALRHAAHYYAGELMDGRLHRHIHLDLEIDYDMNAYGLCVSDDERIHRPKFFTITLNPNYGDDPILQTLAHEMCHLWQYATGKMVDRGGGSIVWMGTEFRAVGIDCEEVDAIIAQPWEYHSYMAERELFERYMTIHWMDVAAFARAA